jgi:ankyrin repeat protein
MSLSGLKDIDREVLKHVEDKELLKICTMDKKTWNEVCDDNFLKRRLVKYPGIEKYKKKNESWKKFFLQAIYYISKMREDFQYEYTSGNFRTQFKLFANYKGNSLLAEAACRGELEIVKYAISKGANTIDDALMFASYYGNLNVVKYLAENGGNIHAENDRALNLAKHTGNKEIYEYLRSL